MGIVIHVSVGTMLFSCAYSQTKQILALTIHRIVLFVVP